VNITNSVKKNGHVTGIAWHGKMPYRMYFRSQIYRLYDEDKLLEYEMICLE
jgi:hypothetical protein